MDIDTKVLELRFPSCSDRLKVVRAVVCATANMYGFSTNDVNSMVLAVNEACMNIIQHAYGGECIGDIVLEILDRSDRLVFRLTDFAEPVDRSAIKPRDLNDIRPGGLGVHLINQVMDEVHYSEAPGHHGNVIEMIKNIKHREGA